jgi:hypothetical protein
MHGRIKRHTRASSTSGCLQTPGVWKHRKKKGNIIVGNSFAFRGMSAMLSEITESTPLNGKDFPGASMRMQFLSTSAQSMWYTEGVQPFPFRWFRPSESAPFFGASRSALIINSCFQR